MPISLVSNSGCWSVIDRGWTTPAKKTGIERTCPLWPVTVEAIEAYLETRTEPKDEINSELVFVTKYGESWFKDTKDNPISNEFRKLTDETKVYRRGLTFYALRHTFETIGGETGDQIAVDQHPEFELSESPEPNNQNAFMNLSISGC